MAKDPRFNFYPDNWSGGTKRMTFEQKGAYMELLLLNFYCLSDGLKGFTQEDAFKILAHAAAYTELWKFLIPKFKTDGTYFWSERLTKEFFKSKKSSEKQKERADKRWNNDSAHAAALPVNGNGISNGNDIEEKGVQGETLEDRMKAAFDEKTIVDLRMTFRDKDLDSELKAFGAKVRGSPTFYALHNTEGLRKAFNKQLRDAKRKNNNGTHITSSTVITPGKSAGKL